jgi:hypothetical protein
VAERQGGREGEGGRGRARAGEGGRCLARYAAVRPGGALPQHGHVALLLLQRPREQAHADAHAGLLSLGCVDALLRLRRLRLRLGKARQSISHVD